MEVRTRRNPSKHVRRVQPEITKPLYDKVQRFEQAEPVNEKLTDTLKAFARLIDKGCLDNCDHCILSKIVIPEGDEAYEYASGKLYGPLTACDLLGILQDEL